MAEITPPLWTQNGVYPAAVDRRLFAALTDDEGVAREDALQVTPAGSGLDVSVSAGEGFVDGTEAATQGRYMIANDAAVTLTPAPADASNARYDLVIARVYDSAYSGMTDTWALEIVQGTAASTPLEPAVPANSLVLARLSITAGLATITTTQIQDRRSLAPYKAGSPIGTVVDFAAAAAPAGWLRCDGSSVSRTLYAPLFDVIGTTYGAGDGSTTFALPDLRGRVRIGRGPLGTDDYALAATGGEARHTLTSAEMPAHTHTGPSHTHTGPSHSHGDGSLTTGSAGSHSHVIDSYDQDTGATAQPWDNRVTYDLVYLGASHSNRSTESVGSHTHTVTGTTAASGTGNTGSGGTGNTGSAGSGSAHENRPPYLALTPIIRAA